MLNIFVLIKSLFAKKNSSQSFVASCFQEALDLRHSVFLDFYHAERVAYQAKVRCVEVTNTTLRFLFLHEKDYIPAKTMELSCFFVIVQNNKKVPCSFSTRVITSFKKEYGIIVEVEMPTSVEHKQRRNNARIPITINEIPNFQVCCGRDIETLEGNERRNKFIWDIIDKEHVELINISASGVMLTLSKEYELYSNVKLDSLFLCSGNFYSLNKPETSLLLIAKVKRLMDHDKDRRVALGLQFVRWAQVSEEGTSWINADETGVSFLGSWIIPLVQRFVQAQKAVEKQEAKEQILEEKQCGN